MLCLTFLGTYSWDSSRSQMRPLNYALTRTVLCNISLGMSLQYDSYPGTKKQKRGTIDLNQRSPSKRELMSESSEFKLRSPRVAHSLCFKARLCTKLLIWLRFFIAMQIKHWYKNDFNSHANKIHGNWNSRLMECIQILKARLHECNQEF